MNGNTNFKLLRTLHRKMGYPLGKVHAKAQWLAEKLREPGSPTRHVRGMAYKAANLPELITRRLHAGDFTKNIAPAIAARAEEFRKLGLTYFTEHIDPQLMAELNQFYEEVLSKRSETATPYESAPFSFPLAREEDWDTSNILVRFALQDSILQVVTAYFGSVPLLNNVSVMESRSVKIESERLRSSQNWHLDYAQGSNDQIFVWVYLTDVESLNKGPFTLLPIPASRKIKNDFFARRIKDDEIEEAGLAGEIKRVMGPRSTTFLVDTCRCYHMGSRLAPGEKRVACIFSYAKPTLDKSIIKITTPIPEHKKRVLLRQ